MEKALQHSAKRAQGARHLIARVIGCCALSTSTLLCLAQSASASSMQQEIHSEQVWVSFSCGPGCLWQYGSRRGSSTFALAPPTFEIDGKMISAEVHNLAQAGAPIHLNSGVVEYTLEGPLVHDSHLRLGITLQINDGAPVIRFRYVLHSDEPRRLSASRSSAGLTYLAAFLKDLPDVEEVMLSNFAGLTHSYTLSEIPLLKQDFDESITVMGPILAATNGRHSVLLAYEHGSQAPDAFLQYQLFRDRGIRLTAVKGNYISGQAINVSQPYQTIWFDTAVVEGGMNELASSYRRFVLRYMTRNQATRTPYIFYNTWNFQERNKWWNGKAYLDSMNEDRILDRKSVV